jgi:nudix-type nucleoside diphosphatase (YffH/AdpP family)
MKKVVLHSKRRVFDGFFKIDEAELSYERFDGRMSAPLRRLCFERGDAVAAIVWHRDRQQVLLVEQFKYPAWEKGPGWIVETMAGMIDAGESPETALARELGEELGYRAERIEPIATFYVSPGGSSERIVLYYAEVCDASRCGDGGGVEDEGEDIRTVALSLDEIAARLRAGELHDAKTIIAAQWLLDRIHGSTRG